MDVAVKESPFGYKWLLLLQDMKFISIFGRGFPEILARQKS